MVPSALLRPSRSRQDTLDYGDATTSSPTLLLVRRRDEPETLRVAPFAVPVIVDKHALARIVASLRHVPPEPCPVVPSLGELLRQEKRGAIKERRARARRRRTVASLAFAVFTLSSLATVGVLRHGVTLESARQAIGAHLAR
jgi:hypothetical protein